MRVVLDTNVLVSGLIKDGNPRRLLDALIIGPHKLLISKAIVDELAAVLASRRIRRYVTADDSVAFVRVLTATGIMAITKSKLRLLKTADDRILETAYDGEAHLIVTGDRHLLTLGTFKGIRIVTVSEAATILR